MPFNVHTTDKVTMMTVSDFLTIYFEVGLNVIQTLNWREFLFEEIIQSNF